MTYDLKLNYVCSAAVNKAKDGKKQTKRKLFKLKSKPARRALIWGRAMVVAVAVVRLQLHNDH